MTCYPPSAPIRTAVPPFEPVTLEEAKHQCGVAQELSHFDAWFGDHIKMAREQVERDSMLVCATGAYTFKRTDFGSKGWFELPSSLRPVTAVTSITYVANDSTVTTWSSAEYSLDIYSILPTVRLAYGYSWPAVRGDYNGITVTVTAGYATALVVPARVKQAVKLKIHEAWLLKNELDARQQMQSYDLVIDGLRREVYA